MLRTLLYQQRISGNPEMPRIGAAFVLCGLFLLAICATVQAQATEQKDPGRLHAGIQIDSEGIKSVIIRVPGAEQSSGAEVVHTEIVPMALVRAQDGKLGAEGIKAAGEGVRLLLTRIQVEHQVPPTQIYLIGSTDLDAWNLDELIREVKDRTGRKLAVLSLEAEMRFGIIGTIPRRYREGITWFDNRSQSVLIEIGPERIKAGYQQARQPLTGKPYYDFVSVGIPIGTNNFTAKVNQAVGENADLKLFAYNARIHGEEAVKAALRKEVEYKPGLAHRKKVYLKGSFVSAMLTLLHPEDRQPWAAIAPEEIDAFHWRAANTPQTLLNPNLLLIRDEALRAEVKKDLDQLRSVFTSKQLIAGAEMLKAIAAECAFREPEKKILFARFSNMSPVLSYVLLQAENGPQP